MNKWSNIFLLISGFCLIVIFVTRLILQSWHPYLYVFLVVFLAGLFLAVFFNYKFYLSFLTVKTAQKGLSLFWSLLILFAFLSAASYLSHRFNKSIDLTEERLNTLSDETLKALKALDADLSFHVFYQALSPESLNLQQELKEVFKAYRQKNPKIKSLFFDTRKNNLKAEEYLSDLADKNQHEVFVFAIYKGKKIRVSSPFTEEDLTSAIIKVQKREFKDILFLTGHGERGLNQANPEGLKILKQSLSDSGFNVKEWNFSTQGPPQKSVALITSIGPRKPFLSTEKDWLKQYLLKGGRLFLSLDPKTKHELKDFLKNYGLVFNDDIVLTELFSLITAEAMGVSFDSSHPITKNLPKKQPVLLSMASSLNVDPLETFKVTYLVKSISQSFSVPELTKNPKRGSFKSLNLAIEIEPKASSDEPSQEKSFRLIVVSDSDFLSNQNIYKGSNRQLALNSFISLAGDEELLSIPPRLPKGTKIHLGREQKIVFIFFVITLPLIFLLTALAFWFKKRSA